MASGTPGRWGDDPENGYGDLSAFFEWYDAEPMRRVVDVKPAREYL